MTAGRYSNGSPRFDVGCRHCGWQPVGSYGSRVDAEAVARRHTAPAPSATTSGPDRSPAPVVVESPTLFDA